MHPVSDFSSVLEVSVGLHIAYSLIEAIHNKYLSEVNRYLKDFEEMCKRISSDKNKSKAYSALENFSYCVFFWNEAMQAMVFVFRVISGIVAMVSIVLLVLISFFPNFSVPTYVALPVVIMLLLPMPSFVVLTEYFLLSDFEKLYGDAQDAYSDINDQLRIDRGIRLPAKVKDGKVIFSHERSENQKICMKPKYVGKLVAFSCIALGICYLWNKNSKQR